MTDATARNAAIVAIVAAAPIVIVFVAAIVRGYEIHILFRRKRPRRDDERP